MSKHEQHKQSVSRMPRCADVSNAFFARLAMAEPATASIAASPLRWRSYARCSWTAQGLDSAFQALGFSTLYRPALPRRPRPSISGSTDPDTCGD